MQKGLNTIGQWLSKWSLSSISRGSVILIYVFVCFLVWGKSITGVTFLIGHLNCTGLFQTSDSSRKCDVLLMVFGFTIFWAFDLIIILCLLRHYTYCDVISVNLF